MYLGKKVIESVTKISIRLSLISLFNHYCRIDNMFFEDKYDVCKRNTGIYRMEAVMKKAIIS